jgi:hypothetical protein
MGVSNYFLLTQKGMFCLTISNWECLAISDWECLTISEWQCLTISVVPDLGSKLGSIIEKMLNQNVLDYLHRHLHLETLRFHGLTFHHYASFLKVNLMRAIN